MTTGANDIKTLALDASNEAVNIAYRLGNRIHQHRVRRAQKNQLEPVIVPTSGYGTTSWVRILGRALYKTDLFENTFKILNPEDPNSSDPVRGWRSFTSIAIPNAPITITIAGVSHQVRADQGGVIDVKLEQSLPPGSHPVALSTPGSQPAQTSVYIISPDQNVGIICDIDDTIMHTALPRPFVAAWNSFVLNEHARSATPGMNILLHRLKEAHPQAPIIYLSTGAWNITPTLRRFLHRHGYPKGTYLLTDWGPTPDRWFRSGTQHKIQALKRLAEELPHIQWILIGDDGQGDPEIYQGFAQRYPANTQAILIRNLTLGETLLSSGRLWPETNPKNTPAHPRLIEGHDGPTLYQKLTTKGLL